jgi:hypothetical protein
MVNFITQLWTNEKGKRFVVMPEEEFVRLSEMIEDRGLSRIFREAIATDANEPSISFDEVKRQLAASRRNRTRMARRNTHKGKISAK